MTIFRYEGRLRVDQWAFKIGRCCEYHRLRLHMGSFIWRWSA